MKTQFILSAMTCLIILSVPVTILGQIEFRYDRNGNRTSRILYIKGQKKDTMNLNIVEEQQKQFVFHDYDEELGSVHYSIWPNPTGGSFVVTISGEPSELKPFVITFYSLQGDVMFVDNLDSRTKDFNISDYPSGTYVLRLSHNGKEVSWKIIKQ